MRFRLLMLAALLLPLMDQRPAFAQLVREALIIGLDGMRPAEACAAEYYADGGVDGDDCILFVADWDNGRAAADVNRDAGVDGDDVNHFFCRWDTGC